MAAHAGTIERLIAPRTRSLGEFDVRRALPDGRRQRVGPFIFFDHMGPADFAPGSGVDVRPHPHIGLATVTYLFAGQIRHRDSLGYDQVITPGAVNWMTAGSGVVHSERTPAALKASGSHLHGIQAWVALPLEDEEAQPRFDHYPATDIPSVDLQDASLRVITGDAYGVSSPVITASDTLYVEADLVSGATVKVPEGADELAVYVVSGALDVAGTAVAAGTMAVLRPGADAALNATRATKCMLLGGATLAGERIIWWNFVHSSEARIERAKRDWKDGRFPPVPGDDEFIPLPGK